MLVVYPTLPIIPFEFISMCQLVLLLSLPTEISNYIKRITQPNEPVHQSICMSRVFTGRKSRPRNFYSCSPSRINRTRDIIPSVQNEIIDIMRERERGESALSLARTRKDKRFIFMVIAGAGSRDASPP